MFKTIEDLNSNAMPISKFRVNAEDFLNTSRSNLLVNAGQQQMRHKLLIAELNLQDGVSVILTSSPEVENALIEAASSQLLNRKLLLCSHRYPNYDPLFGIGVTAAATFFADVAEDLGYRERSTITSYFAAFSELFVRQTNQVISLRGLYDFSKTPAIRLAEIAAAIDETLYLDLTESIAGAKPFRDILSLIHREFACFSSECESKLSLITAASADKPCIICIRPSGNPKLLGDLFAAELDTALDQPFHLLTCESQLLNDKAFTAVLNKKKQEKGIVALFCENIAGFPELEQLMHNLSRKIILLDGDCDSADLQTALTSLGTCPRFLKMDTYAKAMKLPFEIDLKEAKNRGYAQLELPRALYIEQVGKQAVLISPATDLIVTNHLNV